MSSTSKSLLDQVREIKKLLDDVEEMLTQARWAMATLEFRLAQPDRGAEGED